MRRIVFKSACSLVFLLGVSIACLSQAPQSVFSNITIASPNAASLGKYGDYPVGYNTGVPQIGIPVYSLKEGPLSLNVSLSYHASGLKVQDLASWVGSGWSLNAGGVITRSVIGAPDDRGHFTNTTHGHFSNYGYNSYMFDPAGGGSGTSPGCYSFPEDNIVFPNDGAFVRGERDGEPDLFFFNFGNYSGKFYFRDDRTPVLVPEADFRIEPVLQGPADNIVGFRITASDGVNYYFGKNQGADGNPDAIERTYPYTNGNGLTTGDVNSSWYLNKIVSADDQFTIALIYQPEKYSYYTLSMFPVATGDATEKHTELIKNYVEGVRLSQIVSSNTTINFLPGSVRTDLGDYDAKTLDDLVNTEAKTLGAIQITDDQGLCKGYGFSYGYFEDNTTSLPNAIANVSSTPVLTDTRRLRLDAIQEKTCDNSTANPPYTFSYTTPSGSFAPRRLTFAQDHWGYFNGKTANAGLLPGYTVNDFERHPGADRESSWPELSYGSLNKITYPTGGYTEFTFEPNDVWFNFAYYNEAYRTGGATGPGIGQSGNATITLSATANTYKYTLSFHTGTGSTTSGSASFAGMNVDRLNPYAETIVHPGAGTQTYTLLNNSLSPQTNDWVSASISEEVPASFQDNKIVGGLRIKTITNNAGSGNAVVTNYAYKSGGQSTGVLYSRPAYVQVPRNDLLQQVGYATSPQPSPNGCLTGTGNTGIIYQKSPGSLRPMETVQGNHIGYNRVEVSQSGNGKSVYQYYGSDVWDQNQNDVAVRNVNITACLPAFPNFPAAPLPFEYMRGELKYEAHSDQAGHLLHSKSYYPVFTPNPVTTPAYLVKQGDYSGALTLYSLSTAKKTKMTVVSNQLTAGGDVLTTTDTTYFESPHHNQPTRHTLTDSKGGLIETRYTYAFDYVVPACASVSDCYSSYATAYAGIQGTFNTALYSCVSSGGCNCRWPAFQSYRYYWSLARKNYVACRRTNFADPGNAYAAAHAAAKSAADAELKPILELQDRYINVPVETTSWKDGKLLKAGFNRFDYSPNPAAGVYPNKIQAINVAAPAAAFTAAAVNGSTLAKDSRYSDEASLKYDKGNLVEVTERGGVVTSYLYGYKNTRPVAKISGMPYANVTPTVLQTAVQGPASDAALRTELNKIRMAFPASLVTTYTYKPLAGMTSQTDAGGRTTYYEYDAFGRLLSVRDQDNKILKKYQYQYAP